MIREIVRKELLEIFREGRFRVALLTVAILVVTAIGVGRQYYRQVNEQHEAARRNARSEWVSQGSKNPHSAAHYGTYAFKPKYPMSLLDNGVDKYSGVSIYLEAHKRNDAQYMAAQDQTALSRFGDLSPDFILMFMVPLFIILIAFNSVSRERESGTLRVMMSQGISPWKLASGKWLAVFTPVAVLTGLVFL
ncbi:MAG: ABC transporter permease, partial [Cyclobacteriaceae bacterium]